MVNFKEHETGSCEAGGPLILAASSRAPQLARALFGFGGDAAQFVGNLERALDFVLRRVVGALGALGQIAGAFEPERQLMLNPMRHVITRPATHRSDTGNYKMVATKRRVGSRSKLTEKSAEMRQRRVLATATVHSRERRARHTRPTLYSGRTASPAGH